MQALNPSAQTVRLGVSPMLSALIFPHLLQAYQETFPSSSLQLVENGSLSNRVLVLEGGLDAAIVSCDGPLPPSLGFYDLCTVDISFYVSASHPLAGKASLELSDI